MIIYALLGKSASGKDTIYNKLLNKLDSDVSPVIMHTTRPRRSNEENGQTYFFVTDEELDALIENNHIIETRSYETKYGIWRYALSDLELDDDGKYLMIETPQGYESLVKHFGANLVIPIYVYVEDGQRLSRALAREKSQAKPKYSEMCRRFLADEKDFAVIDSDSTVARFENDNIDNCVEEIYQYIRQHLKTINL